LPRFLRGLGVAPVPSAGDAWTIADKDGDRAVSVDPGLVIGRGWEATPRYYRGPAPAGVTVLEGARQLGLFGDAPVADRGFGEREGEVEAQDDEGERLIRAVREFSAP